VIKGKKSLLITNVSRIDYPGLRDRQEVSSLGLLIYFENTQLILRINIGSTGQNVDFAFQGQEELSLFFSEYYGVLVIDHGLTSKLSQLQGRSVINMYLGYYSEENTSIQGTNFELLSEEMVAIQLYLSDTNIFTFYNDGDEGHYSFSMPLRTPELPFGNISWRELYMPPACDLIP